jgi:hypothetical protein
MTPHATDLYYNQKKCLAINKDICSTVRTVSTKKDKHSLYRDHHIIPGAMRQQATREDTTKGEARVITIRQHLGYGSRFISFDLTLRWCWLSSLGGGAFKKQTRNQKANQKIPPPFLNPSKLHNFAQNQRAVNSPHI